MGEMAVLVCSCDKYYDAWEPFFKLYFKYWSECPYNIYILTNEKICNYPRVKTLNTGPDLTWASSFYKALLMIDEKYIFIIMEDYLLMDYVESSKFEIFLEFMDKENVDCLKTFPMPKPDLDYGYLGDIKIGAITKNEEYRISLQASIWKREYVLSIIDNKDSAWQFEYNGSKRSREDGSKILSIAKMDDIKNIFNYYCTGIIQGYWIREAIELLKKEGITVDLYYRPLEPRKIRLKRIGSDYGIIRELKKLIKKTRIYEEYRNKKY